MEVKHPSELRLKHYWPLKDLPLLLL
ncbi:hypothetical protein Gohar_011998 [Gossypium harknessii]|uniref:Uncharacterized protein n=1 Tax=Gossypium harknessii TaxID=34285 RepID=A0A7J9GVN9_9ROSI|nr:hypothetical protein [Gossypium harknessii]